MKRSFSALQQRHSEAVLIAAMGNRRNGGGDEGFTASMAPDLNVRYLP
jgi:hypothetical protein